MEQSYESEEIISSILVKNTIKNLFDNKEIEIIKRPSSFIIRLKNEPEDRISRVILLPPHGFTANRIDETNPHAEVRKAKIEIRGGVRPKRSGFNFLKNCLKYQYYTIRNIKITEEEPYPKIDGEYYKEEVKSSKQKFLVVKENGVGFYHSLVNLSSEWILLILDKELRFQRIPELQLKIENLDKSQQKVISHLYGKVISLGDTIFENEAKIIEETYNFDVDTIIPILIEMLNIVETGKHEPCTVYAIILKIGKKNKNVINFLKEALKNKTAPKYYLEELIKKLSK
ncbi:TPA: hypothetical protein HA241_02360 [Candidatus Woesearchaeota archaeon]|nr:hypothetical protein [Candidatus Woesearchaeota archaeon]